MAPTATIAYGHGGAEAFYHGDERPPTMAVDAPVGELLLQLANPLAQLHDDFSPVHHVSIPINRPFRNLEVPRFYLTQDVSNSQTYVGLNVTPLPCDIPSGTTLYLSFGAFSQTVVTSATSVAGSIYVPVTSFVSHHNFGATTYYQGRTTNSGTIVTVGLNTDLQPDQILMLNSGDTSLPLQVNAPVRKDSSSISVHQFNSQYPFDSQTTDIAFTGTHAANSNVITVSSTTGLKIGQQVHSNSLTLLYPAYISAIDTVASTITLTKYITDAETNADFTIQSSQLLAPFPMVLGSGSTVETVYPISLPAPVSSTDNYTINLATETMYVHKKGEQFVYYQWPQNLNAGDVTYRPDYKEFVMWDGAGWRQARVNSVQGIYSVLGAIGGNDFTTITVYDPTTGKETPPDNFTNTSSKGYEVHHGGNRATDPSKAEWTGETLTSAQFHIKVRIPQSSSVAFRSLALQASYISAPVASNIYLSPTDMMTIAPGIKTYVNWSFDDLDNQAQTGWEVRIFSDVDFQSDDFNPETTTPFWKSVGHDAQTSAEIDGTIGFVSGQAYWVFVRVAKQFQQTRWWGDWGKQQFAVVVNQPLPPIISIWSNGDQAENVINIQSTDNLLGPNNGGFEEGLGGWVVGNYGTSQATIEPLVTGIALSEKLSAKRSITSLSVGATGYIARGSSIPSGAGAGATFKVSGSPKKNTDPLGFPRAGRFWVSIGGENLLVQNLMDGNKTGDTFKIIQRAYTVPNGPSTTAAALHNAGAEISFGLQNAVHTGSKVNIDFTYSQIVHHTKRVTSLVRYYTGTYGSAGSSGTTINGQTALPIILSHDRRHLTVVDSGGILSSDSIGKNCYIKFNHWDASAQHNVKLVKDKHGKSHLVATAAGNGMGQTEQNTIEGVFVVSTLKQPGIPRWRMLGTVASTCFGNKSQPITSVGVVPSAPNPIDSAQHVLPPLMNTMNSTHIPAGRTLRIDLQPGQPGGSFFAPASGAQGAKGLESWPAINFGRGVCKISPSNNDRLVSQTVTLASDYHLGDTTMHIKGIGSGTKNYTTNSGYTVIPQGSQIWLHDTPDVVSRNIRIHLGQKYAHTDLFKGQKVRAGDSFIINHASTTAGYPAVAGTPGVYLTKPVTSTVTTTEKEYHDVHQTAVVDYNPDIAAINLQATIGDYDGSTFTAYTSGTTTVTYNAMRFDSNPGSISTDTIFGRGLPNGTVVDTVTSIGGGKYVITFKNPATGNVVLGNTPFTTLSGSTLGAPVVTFNVSVIPATRTLIRAGSRTIPIKPFIPKIDFPAYLPVNIKYHTPAYFGQNSLIVNAGSTNTISVKLPPASSAAGWNSTNSVMVRAGQTYGLAAFSKLVSGSGSPLFSLYIDWYTETGTFISTSSGTTQVTPAGVIEGVTLNSTENDFGADWTPNAIIGTAPTGATRAVPRIEWASGAGHAIVNNDVYALSSVMFKALNVPTAGATNTVVTTEIPGLRVGVDSTGNGTRDALVLPTNTPLCGADTLYYLDPLGDRDEVATITNATGTGKVVTYTASNNFAEGMTVSVTGMNPTAYNLSGRITSATSTQFTMLGAAKTSFVSGGKAVVSFRELNMGSASNQLFTKIVGAVKAGDNQLVLKSVSGLGVGSIITIDYGTANAENVAVQSIGADTTITIAGSFAKDHKNKAKAYAFTTGLAHPVQHDHPTGERVAIFNWNRDGYLNTPNSSFYFKVEKSEDGGQSWSPIRNGSQIPVSANGFAQIVDYEVIPNLATQYRATSYFTTTVGGKHHTIHGPNTGAIQAPTLVTQTFWLSSTSDQTKRFPIQVKNGFQESQRHPSGVFYPLGSARPITVSGVVTGRDGNMTVIWTDLDNWQNFLDLINKGEILILTNPVESTRSYIFINADVQISHNAAASPWREVQIQYVEAAPPGYGFTYGS